MAIAYTPWGAMEVKHKTGHVSFVSCLRDLLETEGHQISEEMVFGLGCGLGFSYNRSRGMVSAVRRPEDFFSTFFKNYGGRCDCQHAGYRSAWPKIKWNLDRGKPVVVGPLDLRSLTYLKVNRSQPTHFVTLVGYEGSYVYVHDCRLEKKQRLSMARLEEAWSNAALYRFSFPKKSRELKVCLPSILLQYSNAFLEPATDNIGITGEESLSGELPDWQASDDELEATLVGLNASGGPAFRDVYGWFVVEAKEVLGAPHLEKAAKEFFRAGEYWQDFAKALEQARRTQKAENRRKAFAKASEEMRRISVMERMAFGSLRYAAQRIA